jgi:ankyrin repeat protein
MWLGLKPCPYVGPSHTCDPITRISDVSSRTFPNVNITQHQRSTALIAAAIKGQLEVSKYLIAQNAEVDAVHSDGWTALIACADEGRSVLTSC